MSGEVENFHLNLSIDFLAVEVEFIAKSINRNLLVRFGIVDANHHFEMKDKPLGIIAGGVSNLYRRLLPEIGYFAEQFIFEQEFYVGCKRVETGEAERVIAI